MEYKKTVNSLVIRIDSGEPILKTILSILKREKIYAGVITGIGSVSSATLRFFDTRTKTYVDREFTGLFEIVSLTGNISMMDDKAYLHCHACLGDKDYKAIAGHLLEAVVGATCEIVIIQVDVKIGRKFDEKVGLNLFEF